MKLFPLIDRLKEFAQDNLTGPERDVVIVTRDPAIGSRRMVEIASIDRGFDWEHGKLIITPSVPLYTRTQQEEIERLNQEIGKLHLQKRALEQSLMKRGGS